ncbi:protein ANTAGONIST OF LIKE HETEROCHROMATIN PROTEIN 1-like [Pyrus communis]|uniref:protein ANTAGONIST OF LIKE HETEROCHROMATIN PROTEIN 1-like n=1 Tax=Pyrus communis TaxID=23211 RepID=UPI0035C12687
MAQVFTMNAQLLRYRQQQRRQREIASLEQRTFVRLHVRREEINRITRLSDTNCLWELRMDRNAFAVLCDLLQTRGGLVDDGQVTIEEQVATFVNILAHHNKNRSMQVRFFRSGETISRYVRRVLRTLLSLQDMLFAKPTPIPEDCTESRWKCFKLIIIGCLGALDGTYIGVTVPDVDRPRYRTRKGHIATNVLGVCTHDLKFVYVLSGWEGLATDSRVLGDAVTRANGLKVPTGTYYLVDSGYTNGEGFLALYRGTRYHLQEWENNSRAPRNHEEYFNMKHSRARNVIERCFGLLKRRWAILRSPSHYPIKIQGRMITACSLLHNFIRMYMAVDPKENARLAFDELPIGEDLPEVLAYIETVESSQIWTQWRDDLAREIYDQWRGRKA